MSWIEIVGHSGAFLSSITFIPQVYKVWQSKSARDLSLTMLVIIFASTVFWIAYGTALALWPVILCNSIISILSLTLIYFKFAFKHPTDRSKLSDG
jgi:MtN3 and saliva related transmembrane protein